MEAEQPSAPGARGAWLVPDEKMRRPPTKSQLLRVALAGAIVAFAGLASGQSGWPDGLVVDWQAPATCPGADRVQGAIASVLSVARRNKPLEHPTKFAARVTETSAGFRLEVRTTSAIVDETKTIDGDLCPLLVDAFALVVAFAVDPATPPPSQPSASARPHDSAPPDARRPIDEALSSSKREGHMALGLGPLASTAVGVLPVPAFGFGAAVGLGRRLRWELEGRYWLARRADLDPESGPGAVDVSLLSGRFSACLSWSSDHRWAACAGMEVGRMRGQGTLVTAPGRGDSWWAAAGAGVATRLSLSHSVDLRFRIDVGLPIFRPSFTIQHADVASVVEGFRPAPVFAMLTFQPEVSFFSTENSVSGHP
jgi:hypothetical protein